MLLMNMDWNLCLVLWDSSCYDFPGPSKKVFPMLWIDKPRILVNFLCRFWDSCPLYWTKHPGWCPSSNLCPLTPAPLLRPVPEAFFRPAAELGECPQAQSVQVAKLLRQNFVSQVRLQCVSPSVIFPDGFCLLFLT